MSSEFTAALEKLFESGDSELFSFDAEGEEAAGKEGTTSGKLAAQLSPEELALYESITSSISDIGGITSSGIFTKLFGENAKSVFETILGSEEFKIVEKNFELSAEERKALGIPEKRIKSGWEVVISDIKMLCARVDKLTAVGDIGKKFLSTSSELAKFYLVRLALEPRIAAAKQILKYGSERTMKSVNSIQPASNDIADFSDYEEPLRSFFTVLKFITSVYEVTSQLLTPLKHGGKFLISAEVDIEQAGNTPSSFAQYLSGLATEKIIGAVTTGTKASNAVLMDLVAALNALSIYANSTYDDVVQHITNQPDSVREAISKLSIEDLDTFTGDIDKMGETEMEMIKPEKSPDLGEEKKNVLEAFFKLPDSWANAEKKISDIIKAVKA